MVLSAFISEWAVALARWGGFLGAALVVGLVILRRVSPERREDQEAIRLARLAAFGVIATAIIRMMQQSIALAPSPAETMDMPAVLRTTPWGIAWHVQVLGAAVVMVTPREVLGARMPMLGPLVAMAIVAAPAFQGHALGSESWTVLAVLADMVHVAASGAWLGTLAVIALVVFPRRDVEATRAAVLAFSPIALASAAALGVTGLFAAWLHVRPLAALWQSDYGLMLVRKLVLFALILAVGAINWKRVTPRLHETAGISRLRRSAGLELLLAVLTFLLTAYLVATPLPGE